MTSYRNAPCELHGVKLKDCGCSAEWADYDWLFERSNIRARRLGRLYAQAENRRFAESLFGQQPVVIVAQPVGEWYVDRVECPE